jgi:hypothetical protein
MNKRPYLQWFDATLDIPIQDQVDDPANLRLTPVAAANARSILGGDGNVYTVSDFSVNPRGSKNIVWSSEGYNSLGNNLSALPPGGVASAANIPNNQAYNAVAIPALTATQKKTTGSTGSATTGNIGTLLGATPPVLDLSAFHSILLVVNLISFTGGASPSFQPEFDVLDDTASPLSIALWKPTAVTSATAWYVYIDPQQMVIQNNTAPTASVGAGVTAWLGTTGITYVPIPVGFPPNGQFQWTITGAPTAVNWTTFIYGKY